MTDKEIIERWLKGRLADLYEESQCELPELPKEVIEGKMLALREMLSFIDSLQEEPVSKEIGDYDHKAVMESLHPELKEEPVSGDLGEYINELSKQFPEVSFAKLSRIAVRVTKWQKQQDQSTIELAEDHAMLAGMEKMKEQMMAKAVDAQCFGFQGAALFSFRLPATKYLVGSNVKVIVIEED